MGPDGMTRKECVSNLRCKRVRVAQTSTRRTSSGAVSTILAIPQPDASMLTTRARADQVFPSSALIRIPSRVHATILPD